MGVFIFPPILRGPILKIFGNFLVRNEFSGPLIFFDPGGKKFGERVLNRGFFLRWLFWAQGKFSNKIWGPGGQFLVFFFRAKKKLFLPKKQPQPGPNCTPSPQLGLYPGGFFLLLLIFPSNHKNSHKLKKNFAHFHPSPEFITGGILGGWGNRPPNPKKKKSPKKTFFFRQPRGGPHGWGARILPPEEKARGPPTGGE